VTVKVVGGYGVGLDSLNGRHTEYNSCRSLAIHADSGSIENDGVIQSPQTAPAADLAAV